MPSRNQHLEEKKKLSTCWHMPKKKVVTYVIENCVALRKTKAAIFSHFSVHDIIIYLMWYFACF